MKAISLVVCASAVLGGCSVNGTGPVTAWGKKDVTMIDYRTDAGECAVLGVTLNPDGNAAKSAGGISGQNSGAPPLPRASGNADASSGKANQTGAGGTPTDGSIYRDSASSDFVNRAATQQQNEELAAQRARKDALKSCLAGRGYTEFALTPEQRAELAKLPQGSAERRDYLYKLGTDPDVLTKQSVKK